MAKYYQCPICKSCFPENVWESHRSNTNLYYFCPSKDCHTKLHWEELEKPLKDIN